MASTTSGWLINQRDSECAFGHGPTCTEIRSSEKSQKKMRFARSGTTRTRKPTPVYDPESNRIERLWRSLRRAVTHTHSRDTLPPCSRQRHLGTDDLANGDPVR